MQKRIVNERQLEKYVRANLRHLTSLFEAFFIFQRKDYIHLRAPNPGLRIFIFIFLTWALSKINTLAFSPTYLLGPYSSTIGSGHPNGGIEQNQYLGAFLPTCLPGPYSLRIGSGHPTEKNQS